MASHEPPSWWRPPLAAHCLLDAVASEARGPVVILGGPSELLLPAVVRFPTAILVTATQDGAAWPPALLPAIRRFAGIEPTVLPLRSGAPDRLVASIGTVLWLDPGPSAFAERLPSATGWLGAGGLLAIAERPGRAAGLAVAILHRRRQIRRNGYGPQAVTGYLGPRARVWSALGRVALAAGRPDLYDHCHAAMRQAYAERWPVALACRLTLTTARKAG